MPILGCKGLMIAADLHPNIILFMWLFPLHQVEENIKHKIQKIETTAAPPTGSWNLV